RPVPSGSSGRKAAPGSILSRRGARAVSGLPEEWLAISLGRPGNGYRPASWKVCSPGSAMKYDRRPVAKSTGPRTPMPRIGGVGSIAILCLRWGNGQGVVLPGIPNRLPLAREDAEIPGVDARHQPLDQHVPA